jgi:hypothetical protein
MKFICVGDEPGFTIGKVYNFEYITEKKFDPIWILIENDFGEQIKNKLNEFSIKFLTQSNIWVEFIDDSRDGLTTGKYYNLLDRFKASLDDEHYYFLDDNNEFIGAYRGNRFRDVSKIKFRNDRLEELGI